LGEQESSAAEVSSSSPETDFQARLTEEVEILRWCIGWLEQLARGETVVVNLRAETDPKTAWVTFDQMRVLQVLSVLPLISMNCRAERHRPRMTIHRSTPMRMASRIDAASREPEPELSSLSQREQQAILREKMGLPPSYDPRR
jgi:hypothetical protein